MTFTSTPPCIIGHRGAAGLAPENTLPSFERAVALGVDAVELDVYTVDGELVVIHDDTLERTTNGRGAVMAQTLSALRQLDAGNGAQIPTLAEVWATLPATVALNIELKGPHTAAPVGDWLSREAGELTPGRIMVSAFDHAELARFCDGYPGLPVVRAPLLHKWRKDWESIVERFDTRHININQRVLTEARARQLVARGLYVSAYTVNAMRRAATLTRWGVSALFTDRPDRVSRRALAGQSRAQGQTDRR